MTIEGTSRVTLPCPASSEPPPTITWYSNNLYLPLPGKQLQDRYGNLTVLGVVPQDAGVYTCIAASPGGVRSRAITLRVKGDCWYGLGPGVGMAWAPGVHNVFCILFGNQGL